MTEPCNHREKHNLYGRALATAATLAALSATACSTSQTSPPPDASSRDASAASDAGPLSDDAAAAEDSPDALPDDVAAQPDADASADVAPDDASDDSPPDSPPDSVSDAPAADAADTSTPDAPPDAPPYDGPTGTPDLTFGTSGTAVAPFPEDGGSFGQLTSVALDPDAGTLMVGGTALLPDQSTWAAGIARFTSAGTPDTTFASTGILVTDFGLSTQPVAGGLAIQPDHRTLVAGFGYASLTANGFYVARLGRAGALDTTFATSGLLSTSPASGFFDGADPILLDATGFYVAGWEGTGSASDFALWRFDSAASLVTSFGTGGKVTTTVEASRAAHATAMVRQSTGKILLAGGVLDPMSLTYDAAVARFATSGALDTTFGTSGIALSGQMADAQASALAVQPDDRVVAAGYTTPATRSEITVWRLTADGALDTTFGTGGQVVYSFAQLGGRASSVALQADGRIVVAGSVFPIGLQSMFVMRLLPDGSLDADFAGGGVLVSTSGVSDSADVLAIQPDGAILVAGTTGYGELALWRYR